MITDAIKSIVEAEDASEKEIALAEEKKATIIAQAESQADKIRAEGLEQIRKSTADETAKAFADAENKRIERENELKALADETMKKYLKNKDTAVKAVLENIG